MTRTTIEVSERDEIKVLNPHHATGNIVVVMLGGLTLELPEVIAVELQEALEKSVVNTAYWYENMDKENERLQDRIELLEEKLESLGEEVE